MCSRQQGKFIVIEGLEGAGKTTACDTVEAAIKQAGISEVVRTREPGGTPMAEKIRQLLLETHQHQAGNEQIDGLTEILLFYAARVQLVREVIMPALERGAWVVGDRHTLSTEAYQSGGRGFDEAKLLCIRQCILGNFTPDLTLYMDVEPQTGLARIKSRGYMDRIEQEKLEFFVRARQFYQHAAATRPQIDTIDAMQPLAVVQQTLIKRVTDWIKNTKENNTDNRSVTP